MERPTLTQVFRFSGERSCYDEGKRTAEALTMDYHRGSGVDVSSGRRL
jgi:hypothetical protein